MKRAAFALALAAGFAALACGPTAQPSGSGSAATGGSPRSGGILNVHVGLDPFDWDLSYVGKSTPNGDGQALAYDSLVQFKTGADVPYSDVIIEPALAEKWEISPDARTYTFHLRKGVKWANLPPVNGRELTSADVKWTYEYWSRTGWARDKDLPQGQFDSMFEGMEGIETPDPYTAVVKFKDPFVPFLNYAGSDYNPIVPHEIYDQDGHLHDRIVGTGAFQLDPEASQKGSRWVWKKNPNYWEPGKPYIDEVRWLVIPDDAAAIAAFQAKQVDLVRQDVISYRTVQELAKNAPQAQVYAYQQGVGWHIYLQTQKPPFNDIRIRRALALSIDRDELSTTLQGTKAPWAPTGALLGLVTDEQAHQMLKFDPAEARKLVAEAGYPDGIDITWEYPGDAYGDVYVSSLQLMQAQARKAGINFTLKSMDKNQFSSKRKAKDFTIHMVSASCGGLQEEFETLLYPCFHSGLKGNYADVRDPELDKLLEAQRAEINPDKRRQLLIDAVRRIADQAWAINLYYAPRWEAFQPWLKNYAPNLAAKGTPVVDAWVER